MGSSVTRETSGCRSPAPQVNKRQEGRLFPMNESAGGASGRRMRAVTNWGWGQPGACEWEQGLYGEKETSRKGCPEAPDHAHVRMCVPAHSHSALRQCPAPASRCDSGFPEGRGSQRGSGTRFAPPPAAPAVLSHRSSCLFSHIEKLGFFQVLSWAAGDEPGKRVGEKSGSSWTSDGERRGERRRGLHAPGEQRPAWALRPPARRKRLPPSAR